MTQKSPLERQLEEVKIKLEKVSLLKDLRKNNPLVSQGEIVDNEVTEWFNDVLDNFITDQVDILETVEGVYETTIPAQPAPEPKTQPTSPYSDEGLDLEPIEELDGFTLEQKVACVDDQGTLQFGIIKKFNQDQTASILFDGIGQFDIKTNLLQTA